MVRKVCVDSDVLIGLLMKDERSRKAIESLDASLVTTAVTAFEVWYGRKVAEPVFEMLQTLDVLVFDEKAARLAADILRELKRKGSMLDMRDVFIAATCITNDAELLTFNKKHFERLKSFGLLIV